jgi:uncharacterized protein
MSSRLPDYVDPWRQASLGKAFSGVVRLDELPRLADALVSTQGEARFSLEFYRDEKKRARVRGHVETALQLQCQRCLEPLQLDVDTQMELAVIEVPEEAELLTAECDPVWVEDGRLRLLDLVEDELILSIPQVPVHGQGECPVELDFESAENLDDFQAQADETDRENNPFAVLAGLKSEK